MTEEGKGPTMEASVPGICRRAGTAALAGMVLAVAGCGGEGGGDAPSPDTATTSGGAGVSPSADSVVPGVEPDTVSIRLTEYRIQMPRTLPPGPTVFRVTNSGAVEHSLELWGEGSTGLREKFARNLHPTQTRDLEVVLEPGKYQVFCPVGNHLRRGMLLILEVSDGSSPRPPEG